MKRKILKLLLLLASIAVLALAGILLQSWLNRPLSVVLDEPTSHPIKDVIIKSHDLEYDFFCGGNPDVNILDEVYRDTKDFRPTKDHKILIAKYLGEEVVEQAGYLTYKKAYFLWSRSGDPYPRYSPEPTQDNSTKLAPTPKPFRYCPEPNQRSEVRFISIAIRDDRAIVEYEIPGSINEAILIRVDNMWFIVDSRVTAITV